MKGKKQLTSAEDDFGAKDENRLVAKLARLSLDPFFLLLLLFFSTWRDMMSTLLSTSLSHPLKGGRGCMQFVCRFSSVVLRDTGAGKKEGRELNSCCEVHVHRVKVPDAKNLGSPHFFIQFQFHQRLTSGWERKVLFLLAGLAHPLGRV
jgi:hypothetical protein